MPENDSNRRQQIMDAALKVFARKGFAAATIKDIAKEAGVKSPALIYWYFPNKQELLSQLMLEVVPIMQQISTSPQTLMELPPEEMLAKVAASFLRIFGTAEGGQLVRIFLTELGHIPEFEERVGSMQKMMLHFFSRYLQHQIDLGRIRPCNTQSVVRMFVGMMLVYVMSSEVFPWLREGLVDPETYAREAVEVFLKGLRPD